MKMKRILSAAIAAALAGTMMTACGKSDSSSATKGNGDGGSSVVNIAIQPSAAFIPLFIARENGWIEEALKEQNVTVNWNDFESGPPMNESLAAGSSDIGVMGDVPTVSAIAAGQKTEIVAMAADGPESYAMLVSADSDINSAADLKGKKIATVVGSTGHNLTDKLLKTVDLDINTDVELVNISAGDAATVLSNGEVDAVAMWEPTNTRLVDDGTAKVIATGSDCGLLGVNPIIARSEYADANPEVIKVIIEQYARGVQALANLDDETKAKVAEDLSLEADQLDKVAAKYSYTVEISDDDIENLQDTIKFLVKIGNLDEEYDFAPYADREFTKSANISQYLG